MRFDCVFIIVSPFFWSLVLTYVRAEQFAEMNEFFRERRGQATPMSYEIFGQHQIPKRMLFFDGGESQMDKEASSGVLKATSKRLITFPSTPGSFRLISWESIPNLSTNQLSRRYRRLCFDGESEYAICQTLYDSNLETENFDFDRLENFLSQSRYPIRTINELLSASTQENTINDLELFPLFLMRGLFPFSPTLFQNTVIDSELESNCIATTKGLKVFGINCVGFGDLARTVKEGDGQVFLSLDVDGRMGANFDVMIRGGELAAWIVKRGEHQSEYSVVSNREFQGSVKEWALNKLLRSRETVESEAGYSVMVDEMLVPVCLPNRSPSSATIDSHSIPFFFPILLLTFATIFAFVFVLGGRRISKG